MAEELECGQCHRKHKNLLIKAVGKNRRSRKQCGIPPLSAVCKFFKQRRGDGGEKQSRHDTRGRRQPVCSLHAQRQERIHNGKSDADAAENAVKQPPEQHTRKPVQHTQQNRRYDQRTVQRADDKQVHNCRERPRCKQPLSLDQCRKILRTLIIDVLDGIVQHRLIPSSGKAAAKNERRHKNQRNKPKSMPRNGIRQPIETCHKSLLL